MDSWLQSGKPGKCDNSAHRGRPVLALRMLSHQPNPLGICCRDSLFPLSARLFLFLPLAKDPKLYRLPLQPLISLLGPKSAHHDGHLIQYGLD